MPIIHSIRWRLVASYVVLTLLAVSLVGLLALALMQEYTAQQERAYLTANAQTVANQAWGMMSPVPHVPELAMLAQSAAFMGDVQVRILDARHQSLIDSGPQRSVDQMVWLAPPGDEIAMGTAGMAIKQSAMVVVGAVTDGGSAGGFGPVPPPPDWIEAGLPPGTQYVVVSRVEGPWGSRFVFDSPATEADGWGVPVEAPPFENLPVDTVEIEASEPPQWLLDAERRPRSANAVMVPIGEPKAPMGYVELSQGPDFSAGLLDTARRALVFAALAATLVAGAVGLVVSQGLTAPLRDLALASNQMSQGDLSVRAPVRGRGEIAQLATQFNHMAAGLQTSFAALATERDSLRHFIADASHELRTPIAALKNFNALLPTAATDDASAHAEFVAESRVQIERLEWITRNLLDLSRLDAGLVTLDLARHQAGELLTSAAAAFQPAAQAHGVTLEVIQPEAGLELVADGARLELALSNLIDNAIKFTPRGGHVQTGAAPDDAGGVRLWVRDDGTGLAPDELPHIFERFYRGAHPGVTGSGLGLAIVQSIVQLHGGRVEVESAVGAGSTFSIVVPPRVENL